VTAQGNAQPLAQFDVAQSAREFGEAYARIGQLDPRALFMVDIVNRTVSKIGEV
jgi:hypothetical protein